ncbi:MULTISPECIES: MipA/OmpV family protein [Nitrospirillum]|uniref:Outer membrane scaffolding protein for murein synthesis (MipA/OmpV family) n=1 Tax=Nitrospirillum amazonense TaxID=28077 RepID=A0A560FZK5_9PROT|nr:MipA/OmpV family protein [Nitrospirillum amazonense]MEC4591124.1 MipA/OmpV family protein [Nitrospirillum amazonense]TWB27068.1 outer membrane scaffolding protein for murein synthesis (MipA/OmpV family) [Nitrospirillum amazonense]
MLSRTSVSVFGAALLAGATLSAVPALADDPAASQTRQPPVWDITVGGGVAVRPNYEGSDHYRVAPLPLVTIRYDDMLALGPEGLSAYWHQGNVRVGAALTFDPGRNDSNTNGLFSNGDDRLKGLGDIDTSLGVKLFGAYQLGRISLDASVTKYTGDQNDGVVLTAGAGLPFKLADHLILTPHVGTTWANDNYMQTYFGVTPVQAAHSRFAAYTAGSGFKDVSAGVGALYRFNEHWFVTGDVSVKRLLGDAADSPVTYDATSARAFTAVGYRF